MGDTVADNLLKECENLLKVVENWSEYPDYFEGLLDAVDKYKKDKQCK